MTYSIEIQSSRKILRKKQVCERIAFSRSSLHNKINPKSQYFDPTFPRAVRLGSNAIGWYESEIDAWLQSRERVFPCAETASQKPQRNASYSLPVATAPVSAPSSEPQLVAESASQPVLTPSPNVDKPRPTTPAMERPIIVEVRRRRVVQVPSSSILSKA